MSHLSSVSRRTFLRATPTIVVGGTVLAGCTGDSSGTAEERPADTANSPSSGSESNSSGTSTFGAWLSDTGNYSNVADKTGTSEVTVSVGVQGNNGAYAFAPPAIKISTGTTVLWKWTGKGGNHDVVAQNGNFESELQGTEGATFEHSFDSSGTYKYYCTPHRAMGMKGGIVVK